MDCFSCEYEDKDTVLLVLLLPKKTMKTSALLTHSGICLTFTDLQCLAFAGYLFSSRRCSAARLTILKVNNDAADFF